MSETETDRDRDLDREEQGEDTYFVEITDQFSVDARGDPRITCEKEAREHVLRMINAGEYPCHGATVVDTHTDRDRCIVDGCENKLLTRSGSNRCVHHVLEEDYK